jgi:vacuolar protein sorting-associated protein 72
MLGCFVGPAEAARGVPERFTGKAGPGTVKLLADNDEGPAGSITGKTRVDRMALNGDVSSTPTPAATRAAPPEPMEIDKA